MCHPGEISRVAVEVQGPSPLSAIRALVLAGFPDRLLAEDLAGGHEAVAGLSDFLFLPPCPVVAWGGDLRLITQKLTVHRANCPVLACTRPARSSCAAGSPCRPGWQTARPAGRADVSISLCVSASPAACSLYMLAHPSSLDLCVARHISLLGWIGKGKGNFFSPAAAT